MMLMKTVVAISFAILALALPQNEVNARTCGFWIHAVEQVGSTEMQMLRVETTTAAPVT
jgi:hypothetical protein